MEANVESSVEDVVEMPMCSNVTDKEVAARLSNFVYSLMREMLALHHPGWQVLKRALHRCRTMRMISWSLLCAEKYQEGSELMNAVSEASGKLKALSVDSMFEVFLERSLSRKQASACCCR